MTKKNLMQLIFGLPILGLSISCILLDSFGTIDVEKFGYAFFGGVIVKFLDYFFRKKPPDEKDNDL